MTTLTAGTTLVSFRNADEPRAMQGPLIAVAQQHSRGWTLSIPGAEGSVEAITFEAVVALVQARTAKHRLLIVWTTDQPGAWND